MAYEKAQIDKGGSSVRYGGVSYTIPADVFSISKNPGNWGVYTNSLSGTTLGFYYLKGTGIGTIEATGVKGHSIFWRLKP